MFSTQQKREIADAVQKILRATNHPELPAGEINFALHVDGAESWSWADIRNNGAVINPSECCRPGVEGHFHRLLSCDKHLRDYAGSDQAAELWQSILDQWKVEGFPNPETWQHPQKHLLIEPYKIITSH